MSAIQDSVDFPLRNRLFVVALVAFAHALLAWSWVMLPSFSKPVRHEMSVSVTLPVPPQPAPPEPVPPPPEPPKPKPVAKPRPVEPQRVHPEPQVAMPDAPEEMPPPPVPVDSAPPRQAEAPPATAPVREPDREPDYQAAYLNNPAPAYPMVARRMGWQGRVVLNVEVLANGLPGQVKLQQSSGHDVLDNVAIKAVSSWRFVAARQNGQAAAKWFLVPIPFILKEAE